MPCPPRPALLVIVGLASITVPAQGQVFEHTKITSDDAAETDLFGRAVAIAGDRVLAGASRDDDDGESSGSVYVFDAASGQQLRKLKADDASDFDFFGYSVAISGATAVVGAWVGDGEVESAGAAYVFDVTTGTQLFKLIHDEAAAFDYFGESVGVSGSTVVVGAPEQGGTGAAYVFDTVTGERLFRLIGDDTVVADEFGCSVAVSGTIAIVGAKRHTHGDAYRTGSAYLFDTVTGEQLFKLTAPDAANHDRFGVSVAISGSTALVGADADDDRGDASGSAYLFDTNTGQLLRKLTAGDGGQTDLFGNAVSLSGTVAVIGGLRDDEAVHDSGSVYVFDVVSGHQTGKLTASDAATGDRLGHSVGVSGTTIVAGAPGNDDAGDSSGSMYLFTPCDTPCGFADLVAPPCVLNIDDIDAFVTAFLADDLGNADCDGNGQLSVDDIDCFVAAFLGGCP